MFNVLGPLTNPAGARRQLLGVYDAPLTDKLAGVLGALGSERAFVVHGSDGLDEITSTGPSTVTELNEGKLDTYQVQPSDFGFDVAMAADLKGGSATENAKILSSVLEGDVGPAREIVIMNAAAAVAAGGLASDLVQGAAVAAEAIDSGKARAALDTLVSVSNQS